MAMPLAVLATAPLAVGRRFPGVAIGVVLLANGAFLLSGRLSWPLGCVAAWLIALGACPVMLPRARAVTALALTELAVLAAVFVPASVNETPWDATLAEAAAAVVAWGAGEMLRSRRQAAIDQAATAEWVRSLRERDAIGRERASIARELHDVVAHHVSMIAVRAATARYAIAGLPQPGETAFSEIAEEARAALTELRIVLGVLRAPEGESEAAPQPRIADVRDLVRRMTSAGAGVTLTMTGRPRSLPGSVELCGYRIVQEALTNAGRHAPGSHARVELDWRDDAVHITVRDDGRRIAAAVQVPGAPAAAAPAADAGFGLLGLRERVAMLGGQFEAGPDEAGGFCVSALLPAAPDGGGQPA